MKVSRDIAATHSIHAYGPGYIRIRLGQALPGQPVPVDGLISLSHSLIVAPQDLITDWAPQTLADLQVEHLDTVLALRPEVILLGTGAQLQFPTAQKLAACYQAGVGIEVMDTGAACRTFNILAAEGRNVMAALLMIGDD